MNFEKNMERIEEILDQMEKGSTTLSDNLKLFEEGVTLTKECQEYLNNYKAKFEVIKEELDEENE